jgi:hypothetical protein
MNQRLTGVVTASAITSDPATAEALSTIAPHRERGPPPAAR